jgi:hypothetical protein
MPACGYVGGAECCTESVCAARGWGQELLSDIPTASEEDKLDHEIVQEFCQFGSIAVVVGRYGPNPGPSNGSGMVSKQSFFPLVTVAECAAVGTGLSVGSSRLLQDAMLPSVTRNAAIDAFLHVSGLRDLTDVIPRRSSTSFRGPERYISVMPFRSIVNSSKSYLSRS